MLGMFMFFSLEERSDEVLRAKFLQCSTMWDLKATNLVGVFTLQLDQITS
jgi:hypothetical protein